MHAALVRRSLGWRAWIAVLAIALAGAESAEVVWHGDADDQDCCAVCCHVRHQPAAELSVSPDVGPADAAELIEPFSGDDRPESERFSRLPARGPPA